MNRTSGALNWQSYATKPHETGPRALHQMELHPPEPGKHLMAQVKWFSGGLEAYRSPVIGWPQTPSIVFSSAWMRAQLDLAPARDPKAYCYAVVEIPEEGQCNFSIMPLPLGLEPTKRYPDDLVFGSVLLRTRHEPHVVVIIQQPFELVGPARRIDEKTWHVSREDAPVISRP
jgi:hypothetical protein